MFDDLDPILHSQLRLAIMSVLLTVEEAEFVFLKKQLNVTSGNLSLQLDKLRTAGYIEIRKDYRNKYQVTICNISEAGVAAFEAYKNAINKYLNLNQNE